MVLTPAEAEAAAAAFVHVVWWEEPEKSWEAICLSAEEFEKEYELRGSNHLIRSWGHVGKSERKSLLAWLEGHLGVMSRERANDFVKPVKEALERIGAGEPGPVIVRTW